MELLPHFGVNCELSKAEFVRRLCHECSADHVRKSRPSLFAEVVMKELANCGDGIVVRKKVGGGKTVKEKHIDVWLLVGAIKRLLKNGKRAKEEY